MRLRGTARYNLSTIQQQKIMKLTLVLVLFAFCAVEANRKLKRGGRVGRTCVAECAMGTFRVMRPNGRMGCWCFSPPESMRVECQDSCPADCPFGETYSFRKQPRGEAGTPRRRRVQCSCDCAEEPDTMAAACPQCQSEMCPEGKVRTIDTQGCVICGHCQELTEQMKTFFGCPNECAGFIQMLQTMDGGVGCECKNM